MSKTNWETIVEGKELNTIKVLRSKTYREHKERASALPELIEEGWTKSKDYADPKYIGVKKDKPFDEVFEDRVWVLFYNLGFKYMNKDRNFKMSYDFNNPDITQQIDIFAADDETIIIVECKSAETMKSGNFKKPIEALYAQMDGLRKEALKKYPGMKVKFIWATKNYQMSHADLNKLNEWEIAYFSETTVKYYEDLVKHIGSCARYQLLGNLFANQTIKNMDNLIPAIQGKMGGNTYYAFSIEPEKLLKIGYVLHRNEANKNMMPTYQRIIKKNRLKQVRSFIDNGGYFPNSLIISFDTNGKGLQFDQSASKVENSISKLGILHIPKKYRSAYIIDGQHRLYGYSDSKYASSNTVPVVAFVDLEREEQIKIFMDINENQKAVPKTLRVTLIADMLWDSQDYNERRQALRSKVAQMLGEEETSPLFGRIVIGEDEKDDAKTITVEAIQSALKKCQFFSAFGKKNEIVKDGTFDKGSNQSTCDIFYPFIEKCLLYIQENSTDEWNKTDSDFGMMVMNRGMQAIIRVINDIINHLCENGTIAPKTDEIDEVVDQVKYYIDPLIRYIENLSIDDRKELRSYFGGGADTRFWRAYQRAIANERTDFNPEGLVEYWENEAKTYNDATRDYILKIEKLVKKTISARLSEYHGKNWLITGLPKPVYTHAKKEADEQMYEIVSKGGSQSDVDIWDFVTLNDCKDIVLNGKNWSELFETSMTRPNEKKLTGGKNAKADWLTRIYKIGRKLLSANYSVPTDEYQEIKDTYDWLVETME